MSQQAIFNIKKDYTLINNLEVHFISKINADPTFYVFMPKIAVLTQYAFLRFFFQAM